MSASMAAKLSRTNRQPLSGFEIRSLGPSLLVALVASWIELAAPGESVRVVQSTDNLRPPDVLLIHLATGRRLAIFGTLPDRETIAGHVRAGTESLIGIDASPSELRLALQSLEGGPAFVSVGLVRTLAQGELAKGAASGLSAREREVLSRVSAGLSNKEVADALFLSPNTVRSHLQSASLKLGVTTRAKLVFRARELGLI